MTRTMITAEIARIESSAPSRFASISASRAARLVELNAMLATATQDVVSMDADENYRKLIENADAASSKNMARARWC